MYTNFFGFQSMPFRVSSNTGHFYLGSYYREVYQELFENIREGKSALLLTGYAGTGKTTLIRQVINNLEGMVRPVRIQRSHLNFESLIDEISHHLDLEHSPACALTEKISVLRIFWAEQSRPVTVIIDQADQLSHQTLVDLLSLLEAESVGKYAIQLILVGLPELEDRFYTASLHRLNQDDIHYCRLEPLASSEIEPYIDDCLQHAGGSQKGLFSAQALERVVYYSKGFPLSINTLCGGALLSASLEEQTIISAEMIDEAARHCEIPNSLHETAPDSVSGNSEKTESLADDIFGMQKPDDEYIDPESIESEIRLDEIGEDDLEAQFNHRTEAYEVEVEQPGSFAKGFAIAAAIALLLGGGFFLAFESSQLMSEQMASLHNAIEVETAEVKRPKTRDKAIPFEDTEEAVKPPQRLPEILQLGEGEEAEVFAAMESPEPKKLPLADDIGRDKPDLAVLVKNRVEGLLLVADQQIAAKQLMTPEDDCAWHTYQTILEQQPGNAQALAGISKIKQTYARWARYEVRKDNLEHARYLYGRALKIVPDDAEILAAIRQLNEGSSTADFEVFKAHVPERNTAVNAQQAQLEQLYKQAEEQIAKRQLLTPEKNNAVKSYQAMLTLEPGNREAIEGLGRVKQIYVIWGESEMEKENWQRAKIFFQRALSLAPDDKHVLNLLDHAQQND